MAQTKVTDDVREVTEVDAAKITTGTIPEARITSLAASKLTGTVDNARISLDAAEIPNLDTAKITSGTFADARISEASVTQHVTAVDLTPVKNDISLLALQTAINGNMSAFGLKNSWIEQFENSTYIENLTNVARTSSEFVASAYSEVSSSQTLVDRTAGTAIGEFTGGGGLASAFDGVTTIYGGVSAGQSATKASSTSAGFIGKDWGSGVTKAINGFKAYAPTSGDQVSGSHLNTSGCSVELYGYSSDDTGSAVNLGGLTGQNFKQVGYVYTKLSGLTTSTAYRYHWIKLTTTISNNYFYLAEVEFYDYPTTTVDNATGSFNSTDVVPQDGENKSSVGLVILYKDSVGTSALNSEIVAKVRANTGQAYQTLVLAGAGTYSDSLKIAVAPAIAVTAGQALSYEISFASQALASKAARIYGVAMTY